MTSQTSRLRKVERDLSPNDAAVLAIKETLALGSWKRYAETVSAKPWWDDPWRVAELNFTQGRHHQITRALSGPSDGICRDRQQEFQFLKFLFHRVTQTVTSMELKVKLQVLRLSQEWMDKTVCRLQGLAAQASICQAAYPLDADTAAAVEDAFDQSVIPSRQVEINVAGWVRNDLADRGIARLPKYLRRYSGVCSAENRRRGGKRFLDPVSMSELRALFGSEGVLDDFLTGRDFRRGYPGIRDTDVCTMFDATNAALSKLAADGILEKGRCVHLPTVPMFFLRNAPIVDGRWLDLVTIELAECGAMAISRGFTLEESADVHPLRTARICPRKVDASTRHFPWSDQMTKWRLQARRNLAKFPGKRKEIGNRPYIDLREYFGWSGRKIKGSLQAQVVTEEGFAVRSWEAWIKDHGGFRRAKLSGVTVGRIGFLEERPHFAIIGSIREAAAEQQLRDEVSFTQVLTIGPVPGLECNVPLSMGGSKETNRDRFRSTWRNTLLDFAGSMFLLKSAISKIEQRYFNGRSIVFPDSLKEINRHLDFAHRLAAWFNLDICELPSGQGTEVFDDVTVRNELDEFFGGRGPINLQELERVISPLGPKKVEEIVDAAMIDCHNSWGEAKQAQVLIEKHRGDKSPFAKYWKRSDSAIPTPKKSGRCEMKPSER